MKKTLILLAMGVLATTSVEAKKVEVLLAVDGLPPAQWSVTRDAAGNCIYDFVAGHYDLFAHVHRNTLLSVVAMSTSGEAVLETRSYDTGFTIQIAWTPPAPFVVPAGEDWSLAVVLQSAKGKMRVIDAMEFANGVCAPAP